MRLRQPAPPAGIGYWDIHTYTQGGSDDGDPRTVSYGRDFCGKYFLRSRAKTCFVGRNLSRRYRHPKLQLTKGEGKENSIATPHPRLLPSLVRSAPIFFSPSNCIAFRSASSRSVTIAGPSSLERESTYIQGESPRITGKTLARGFNGMIDDGQYRPRRIHCGRVSYGKIS